MRQHNLSPNFRQHRMVMQKKKNNKQKSNVCLIFFRPKDQRCPRKSSREENKVLIDSDIGKYQILGGHKLPSIR